MVLRSESVGEQVAADQRGTFAGAAGPGAGAARRFFVGNMKIVFSCWGKAPIQYSYFSRRAGDSLPPGRREP